MLREVIRDIILEVSKREKWKKKMPQSGQIHSTAHFCSKTEHIILESIYIDHFLPIPGFFLCDFCLTSNQFLRYVRTFYYVAILRQD